MQNEVYWFVTHLQPEAMVISLHNVANTRQQRMSAINHFLRLPCTLHHTNQPHTLTMHTCAVSTVLALIVPKITPALIACPRSSCT